MKEASSEAKSETSFAISYCCPYRFNGIRFCIASANPFNCSSSIPVFPKIGVENATLIIKDISEGEKNLLALLFFYFELFVDNKQQQIKPEIELIILDDLISSMDDSNKFYILELMKSLLELPNQQIFVMTHSWENYCNLSYGKDNNQSFATFELRKNNGLSELVKLSSKEKPYDYLFKEIYEFSRKSDEDLKSACQI